MTFFIRRTIGLIILMLSLAWLCRVPDWEPAIAFVTTFFAFISLDAWQTLQTRLSTHDQTLISKFRELLPPDSSTLAFLRDHDLAATFHYKIADPLFTLHDCWRTTDYQFDNKSLEKLRETFFTSLKDFISLLVVETSPHRSNPDWMTMDFKDLENDPEKLATRDELNKRSSKLYKDYEMLSRGIREHQSKAEQGAPANS